jgi:hypothetical protein
MSSSGVSCSGPAFCAVAGGLRQAQVVTWNGHTWSAPVTLGPAGTFLAGMSCPARRFCKAPDDDSEVLTWNGTSWSGFAKTPLEFGAQSVSCPATTFCAMISFTGRVVYFNGSTWSAQRVADPAGEPAEVSCASASFCALVDDTGNAYW